jgi:hypothetical protein
MRVAIVAIARRWLASLMLLLGAAPAGALAQDVDTGWRVSVTPYVWFASPKVDVRFSRTGQPFEAALSFRDILNHTSNVITGAGEVQYDRFGLMGELIYVRLEPGKTFDAVSSIRTVAGFHRVYETDQWNVDLLAGARYNEFRPEGTTSRTDPIIGVRATTRVGRKSSLTGYADFGGFHSGSDWQILGAYDYQWTRHVFLSAGWRYYAFDTSPNDLKVRIKGPVIALTYRF